MDSLPTLAAQNTRIRPLLTADAEALLNTWGNPRVMRTMSRPPLKNVAEAVAFIEGIHQMTKEDSLYQWGVERLADDKLVGTCTLAGIDVVNRRAEIGFAIDAAHWGEGLASDLLPPILDYAFGTLGLHRIDADVDPGNGASLHLLEKFGFKREGYLRECYQVHGELQDAVLLGLLAPEWRQS